MKTNARAHRLHRLRLWAGLVLLLALTFGECGMVLKFGRDFRAGTAPAASGTQTSAIGSTWGTLP